MSTRGVLHDFDSVASPWIPGQHNAEEVESDLFYRTPTRIAGAAVTTLGKPTAGAWQVDRLYRDVHGALYVCTVAGTPGTWVQLAPAIVSANPGSPITGYWIVRQDQNYTAYYWSGSAWVQIGGGALSAATPQAVAGAAATAGVDTQGLPSDHVHPLADYNSTYYPTRLKARLNIVLLR